MPRRNLQFDRDALPKSERENAAACDVLEPDERQQLAESLGPSITSRLNETGGIIHCDWPSRR